MTTLPTVLSLFDYSGVMLRPWADAGYDCWALDIAHPEFTTIKNGIHFSRIDLTDTTLVPLHLTHNLVFVSAFPPCDHLAVSGARWFKGKGLRALAQSITLFATAAEIAEHSGAPYLIENPVSTISTYWRKPDHTFHPHWFTGHEPPDNYTKKTCLWTGNGFVMPPEFKDPTLGPPDDRIHKCAPGPNRKNFRSRTPKGFAQAVFEHNKPKVRSPTE